MLSINSGRSLAMALAVGALALTLAACGGAAVRSSATPQAAQETASTPLEGPIRIALLAPLSGPVAPVGQQLSNAAAVALFERPDIQAELLPFDTRGTPDGAGRAAAEARAANVDVVLGPLFGAHVGTVRQTFAGTSVPILAFTNDGQQAGQSVFAMGLSVGAQVEQMVGFLVSQDKRRLIVIGPQGAYTERAIAVAGPALAANGGVLVRTATYPEEADFNEIAARIQEVTDYQSRRAAWRSFQQELKPRVRSAENPAAFLDGEAARLSGDPVRSRMLRDLAGVYRSFAGSGRNRALAEVVQRIDGVDAMPVSQFDALLLPVGDDNLVAIGSMLDLYNAGRGFAQLTGTDAWQNVSLTAEPSLIGGWFTQASETASAPFMLAYRNSFQETPEPIAILGYHGARVALEAALHGQRPVPEALVRRPEGFSGLAGTVRFGGDNMMRHPISIYQVNPAGLQELQGPVQPAS